MKLAHLLINRAEGNSDWASSYRRVQPPLRQAKKMQARVEATHVGVSLFATSRGSISRRAPPFVGREVNANPDHIKLRKGREVKLAKSNSPDGQRPAANAFKATRRLKIEASSGAIS